MKNLRTFAVADYVKEKKYCSIQDLLDHFQVSPATINRDIAALVKKGAIQRIHGGVAAAEKTDLPLASGSPYQERINWNSGAKQRLCSRALQVIENGDILFLDSSTTVYYLANLLKKTNFSSLTIITNSVLIIREFSDFPSHYTLMSLGGSYDLQLNAFLGASAIRELENLTVKKGFYSAYGIADGKVMTNHESHAAFLPHALRTASRNYLLADRSKFGRKGLFQFAEESDFSGFFREE